MSQTVPVASFEIESGVFEDFLASIGTVCGSALIEVTPQGLECYTNDIANIRLVDVELYAETGVTESFTVAIDTTFIIEALEGVQTRTYEISINPGGGYLRFDVGDYHIDFDLLNPEDFDKDIEEPTFTEFIATIAVDKYEVAKSIEAFDAFGSQTFELYLVESAEFVTLRSDTKSARIEYDIDYSIDSWDGDNPTVESVYSVDLLAEYSELIRRFENVTMRIGNDHPIIISGFHPDGMLAKYWIAPRIRAEDRQEADR